MRGIFKITNKVDNKVYIGESLDLSKIMSSYMQKLFDGKHKCQALQEDWNCYGANNFSFEVLATLDDSIGEDIARSVNKIFKHIFVQRYGRENCYTMSYLPMTLNDKWAKNRDLLIELISLYKDGRLSCNNLGVVSLKRGCLLEDICKKKGVEFDYIIKRFEEDCILYEDEYENLVANTGYEGILKASFNKVGEWIYKLTEQGIKWFDDYLNNIQLENLIEQMLEDGELNCFNNVVVYSNN